MLRKKTKAKWIYRYTFIYNDQYGLQRRLADDVDDDGSRLEEVDGDADELLIIGLTG